MEIVLNELGGVVEDSQFLGGYLRAKEAITGTLGSALNSLADTCETWLWVVEDATSSQFLGGYLARPNHPVACEIIPSQFLGGYLVND